MNPFIAIAYRAANGKFHPGIRHADEVWYWPNITYHSEVSAMERAEEAISTAIGDGIRHWNVLPGTSEGAL